LQAVRIALRCSMWQLLRTRLELYEVVPAQEDELLAAEGGDEAAPPETYRVELTLPEHIPSEDDVQAETGFHWDAGSNNSGCCEQSFPIKTLRRTGAFAEHNQANPSSAIMPGDHIVAVNEVHGDADAMMTELQKGGTMVIAFQRPGWHPLVDGIWNKMMIAGLANFAFAPLSYAICRAVSSSWPSLLLAYFVQAGAGLWSQRRIRQLLEDLAENMVADDRYKDPLAKLHRPYQVPVIAWKLSVQHWVFAYVFGLLEYVDPTLDGGQAGASATILDAEAKEAFAHWYLFSLESAAPHEILGSFGWSRGGIVPGQRGRHGRRVVEGAEAAFGRFRGRNKRRRNVFHQICCQVPFRSCWAGVVPDHPAGTGACLPGHCNHALDCHHCCQHPVEHGLHEHGNIWSWHGRYQEEKSGLQGV